jgi:NADPH-dependent 2,4-dienoyl-CoA reductase/sulfur reductase-like enzyme
MKRPRTDDSTDLSARERNGHGGFVDVKIVNGNHDMKESTIMKDSKHHVVVVGAGPGGLMLAYVVCSQLF